MDNIYTVYADLPDTISAYVVLNSDDSYTIVLNSRLSHERNVISYWHEVSHIQNGDYEKQNADLIEFRAHSTDK